MSGVAFVQIVIRDNLAMGGCLTLDELDDRLSHSRHRIVECVQKLIERGYAERIEIGCYRLTLAGRKSADNGELLTSGPIRNDTAIARKPRANTLRNRAWRAMCVKVNFSIPDLIVVAANSSDCDPSNNLQRYIKSLVKAGYVQELPVRKKGTRPSSNGFKFYRLIKNTGEFAPILQEKKKCIFDYNLKEAISCK